MKLSFNSWFLVASVVVASCDAYTPSVPNLKKAATASSSTKQNYAIDSNVDGAMSQYEAALKAAFQQATVSSVSTAATITATANAVTHSPTKDVEENPDIAMSQYEAALKAAFEQAAVTAVSSSAATTTAADANVQSTETKAPAGVQPNTARTTNYGNSFFSVSPHMMKNNHAFVDPEHDDDELATVVSMTPVTTSTFTDNQSVVNQRSNDVTDNGRSTFPTIDATNAFRPPSTIVFDAKQEHDNILEQQEQGQVQVQAISSQPNWEIISTDINKKIEIAELEQGGQPLSPSAKGDIVGTVLAGSAALGAAAINSPLLMGAALGYASTHILGGQNGEVLSNKSKIAVMDAVKFSKHQLELEHGDVSKATRRIMNHIQHETTDRIEHIQNDITVQAEHLEQEIKAAPAKFVQHTAEFVKSEEFKSMPSRSMNALSTFWNSDEVKNAQKSAIQAIKNGLDSDEIKAVQKRATLSLNDITSLSPSSAAVQKRATISLNDITTSAPSSSTLSSLSAKK